MAGLHSLPLEIRQEIWRLALLPEPGVYTFNPGDFWTWDYREDGQGGGYNSQLPRYRGWMVPKRKHPTAMRLNRESRLHAKKLLSEESRRTGRGLPREYWSGLDSRPFMSGIDVFWVDDPQHLVDFAAKAGEFPHRMGVRHLALSARCFAELEMPAPAAVYGDDGYDDYEYEAPSRDRQPPKSGWEALRRCLKDFKELEDISVVFGPTYTRKARRVLRYDDASEGYSSGWAYDVPDIRIEGWAAGSTEESQAEVDGILGRARADFTSDLEGYERDRVQWEARDRSEQEQEVRYAEEVCRLRQAEPDESEWPYLHTSFEPSRYQGYTADDLVPRHQVAVQAKRMVKLGVLRGRSS
ncbi:hypothetical protein VPNG_01738 [Cytospora leucostoma]|uniref:2EXR domain-containing protein n=1 Tax=Cytospora leucostoma TaxID=1230097 RepID=A0A423XK45_9PEZI|nr:hypothetical protein VPNG_01738 [Cytospora leucostoma]